MTLKTKTARKSGKMRTQKMKGKINAEKIKRDFPILKSNLVFLDSSSSSQKPRQVINAITKYYEEENANVHRGIYKLSETATEKFEKSREKIAKFINAFNEEIIFTKGATESLNLLAYCLCDTLQKGDEIVLTEIEHHSNLVPWQQIAKSKGLKLKYIKMKKDFTIDLEDAKEKITNKTKIVSVTHCSNVLGTVIDVKQIAKIAHEKSAVLVVDGAQAIAHMKVDVKDIDADFYAFSGHKMFGPTGIGILYGKHNLLQKMKPFNYGGGMITEVTFEDAKFMEIPYKFEAGTPDISGAIGLGDAVDYINSVGIENINKYLEILTRYTIHKLEQVNGLKIIGPISPEKNRGPVISFVVDGIHPHDMATILDKQNIAVRAGHHCAMPLMSLLGISGTTRASLQIYNSKEDIDKLVEGIKNAKRIFKL